MIVGSTTGVLSVHDRFEQSEEQIEQLESQLDLMEAQLEDKKHENIITRINNAKLILDNCSISNSEKNIILEKLSNGIKQATLLEDYAPAEEQLNLVVDELQNCSIYPEYSLIEYEEGNNGDGSNSGTSLGTAEFPVFQSEK